MGEVGSFIHRPPGRVGEVHDKVGFMSGAALLLGMKEFSHVGKVPGFGGGAVWLTSTPQGSLRAPIRASASSKEGQSSAGRATYAPHREAPFFPEIPT